jgi:hypothetical protein
MYKDTIEEVLETYRHEEKVNDCGACMIGPTCTEEQCTSELYNNSELAQLIDNSIAKVVSKQMFSRVRERSKRDEASTAEETGGRKTLASGALARDKGDVETDEFVIQNKSVDKVLRINEQLITKVRNDAANKKKKWAMKITINHDQVGLVEWHDLLTMVRSKNE